VRYAKNCHPSTLWNTYFTSSKEILQLVKSDGPESFSYEIRKTFKNSETARAWESRVITKILNWPTTFNKCSWPAISEAARARGNETKRQIQPNGLTIFQNAAIKLLAKLDTIEPISGLTYRELRRQKANATRIKNGTNGKCSNTFFLDNNPSKDPIIRKKMNDSLRHYYSTNKNHFYGKKHSPSSIEKMIEKKLGENNPCYGTIWITNEISNFRIRTDLPIPEGYRKGRSVHKSKKSQQQLLCPHCGMIGRATNMKRYHFDKCKHKT